MYSLNGNGYNGHDMDNGNNTPSADNSAPNSRATRTFIFFAVVIVALLALLASRALAQAGECDDLTFQVVTKMSSCPDYAAVVRTIALERDGGVLPQNVAGALHEEVVMLYGDEIRNLYDDPNLAALRPNTLESLALETCHHFQHACRKQVAAYWKAAKEAAKPQR
jgi:hypothetical protein